MRNLQQIKNPKKSGVSEFKLMPLTLARKFLVIFVVLFCGLLIFAQEDHPQGYDPKMLDEFSKLNSEQLQARLDAVAMEMQNLPNDLLYVRFKRDKNTLLGFPFRYTTRIKTYLVKNRGIEEKRIKIFIGEINGVQLTELWLQPPDFESYFNTSYNPEFDEKLTLLFDNFSYPLKTDSGGCCAVDEYKEEEKQVSLDVFAKQLKDKPKMKGYLIIYGQYCTNCSFTAVYSRKGKYLRDKPDIYLDSPKTVAAISKKEKDYLVKHLSIETSRVFVINGGFREWRELELYLVPKNGKNPKVKPTTFPPKRTKINTIK